MPARVLRLEIHGRAVDAACYGGGPDWVCRLTDPSSQASRHNDRYSPPPDLGFVWLRESDHAWLASGVVHRDVFRDVDTVDGLLYRIMAEVIGDDSQLAQCIEFVDAAFTTTFDGEEGRVQAPGGWAQARWWRA